MSSNTSIGYFFDAPGNLPGTLKASSGTESHLVLIDYSETQFTRLSLKTPEECADYLDTESVSWIDVQGLGDTELLQRLGDVFQLHPLVLEDVVNVPQRPKVEIYDRQLVIITQMVTFIPSRQSFVSEQVSFVLGKHYLLTIQEELAYDCFESIRLRIQQGKGAIRRMGADYLTYALLDAIVDGFFPVLEAYGEKLEKLEDDVILRPDKRTLQQIYRFKRELSTLRHLIWLQRDMLSALLRDYEGVISQELEIYLRDCYDHAVQLLDIAESYRDASAGLMDIYLSAVSNRMNEVMKTLTVISTIFIPLTFIVGVYGMNFDPEASPWNMPELGWPWGYPAVWLVMILITAGLIYFFWRRGWFKGFS